LGQSVGPVEWGALAPVVAVNAALALWSPLLIPPDGPDYLNGAYTLAHGGGFTDFVPYKAPGLTLLLGFTMAVTSHWTVLFHWINAALQIATAVLTWLTARRLLGPSRARRVFAAIAGVAAGVHPILLTYQCYLLRECAGTTLVPLIGWMLVRHIQDRPTGGRALASSATLGVLCGVGSLCRENFQTLLILGPLLIGWGSLRAVNGLRSWRVGGSHAAAAALVAALVMAPWLFWMHRHFNCWSVTTPKTQFNRVINAWENGLIDGTELPGLSRGASDYDYVARAVTLEGIVDPANSKNFVDVVIDALTHRPEQTSDLCARLMRTAISRRPARAVHDAAISAVSLSGLWSIEVKTDENGRRLYEAAHTNPWYALPLRGMWSPQGTNYFFDVDGMIANGRFLSRKAQFDEILAQSRVSVEHMIGSRPGAVFNAWLVACEKTRPVLAGLFLLGLVAAILKRDAGALAISLLVVVNVIGAAVYMMTIVDRFAAPMLPLMILIAVYGLHSLCQAFRAKKTGAAEATPA
jgi:hypothetical protein